MENGVLLKMGLILPCEVEELGCETTSLDCYAYNFDFADNSVLSVIRTEDIHLFKQHRKSSLEQALHPNSLLKSITNCRNLVETLHLYPTKCESM